MHPGLWWLADWLDNIVTRIFFITKGESTAQVKTAKGVKWALSLFIDTIGDHIHLFCIGPFLPILLTIVNIAGIIDIIVPTGKEGRVDIVHTINEGFHETLTTIEFISTSSFERRKG